MSLCKSVNAWQGAACWSFRPAPPLAALDRVAARCTHHRLAPEKYQAVSIIWKRFSGESPACMCCFESSGMDNGHMADQTAARILHDGHVKYSAHSACTMPGFDREVGARGGRLSDMDLYYTRMWQRHQSLGRADDPDAMDSQNCNSAGQAE